MQPIVLILIAVLSPMLGGSTERWAQGCILLLLGVTAAILPPRASLGKGLNLALAGAGAAALLVFLPADWFSIPGWRVRAVETHQMALPWTLTPQPWLTAEAAVLLLAGITWLYCACSAQMRLGYCATAARAFCLGIALLAGLSMYFFFAGVAWSGLFPDSTAHFGPFPNKNQTAHVMAIAALLSIGCAHDSMRQHRRGGAVLWAVCATVLLAGLVMANSRAAAVIFFLGLVAWTAGLGLVARSRYGAALASATTLLLLAAFFLYGGDLANRFLPQERGGQGIEDLRWIIQKDALALAFASPWPGIGLGNFASVAPQFHDALGIRDYSLAHPESDWLWLLDEMGWAGVAAAVAALIFLMRRVFPLAGDDPCWPLRLAAAVAGLMFALHGFVDVAGHRLGSAFAAIFAFSLAMRTRSSHGKGWRKRSSSHHVLPWVFRCAGLLIAAAGALWVHAAWTGALLPGRIGVERVKMQAPELNNAERYTESYALMNRALPWAPLDWELYHHRAIALAFGAGDLEAAAADFRRAAFLEPTTPKLPFHEGLVWLAIDLERTHQAWGKALQRSAPEDRVALYRRMLAVSEGFPEVQEVLARLAADDLDLQLAQLSHGGAPRDELGERLRDFLARDPELRSLSPDQLRTFISLWARQVSGGGGAGDEASIPPIAHAWFIEQVSAREAWLPIAWPFLADALAARGEAQRAYEIALKYGPAPALPPAVAPGQSAGSVAQLSQRFYSNPGDLAAGYALFRRARETGAVEDAMLVLNKLAALPQCPPYVHFLKAQLHAEQRQWPDAYRSLRKAMPSSPGS